MSSIPISDPSAPSRSEAPRILGEVRVGGVARTRKQWLTAAAVSIGAHLLVFVAVMLIVLVAVTFLPDLVLWLPRALGSAPS